MASVKSEGEPWSNWLSCYHVTRRSRKPWKQPQVEMQGKAAYNTPLWWALPWTPLIAVALVHRAALFWYFDLLFMVFALFVSLYCLDSPFQFFTTKPLPCDPSFLPKYPTSKEFDAKMRDEEAKRLVALYHAGLDFPAD